MKFLLNNKKAFTLAEVMITLSILAVVATITIPATVNNFNARKHRTQLQKAMETYESVLDLYRTDNRIAHNDFAGLNAHIGINCANIRKYFKIRANGTGGNQCVFETNDDVWFDFTNGVTSVIVAFDENDLDAGRAQQPNNRSAFILNPAAGNNAVGLGEDQKDDFVNNRTKIYGFVNKKSRKK